MSTQSSRQSESSRPAIQSNDALQERLEHLLKQDPSVAVAEELKALSREIYEREAFGDNYPEAKRRLEALEVMDNFQLAGAVVALADAPHPIIIEPLLKIVSERDTRFHDFNFENRDQIAALCLETLASLPSEMTECELMKNLSENTEPKLRAAAALALRSFRSDKVTNAVCDQVQVEPTCDALRIITATLKHHVSPRSTALLLDLCGDEQYPPAERAEMIFALETHPGEKVRKRLLDLSMDSPLVAKAVITALAGHEHPDSTRVLGTYALGSDRGLAVAAVRSLAGYQSENATALLCKRIGTEDDLVRDSAISALAKHQTDKTTALLIGIALVDKELEARGRAAYALGSHTGEKAAEALLEIANPERRHDPLVIKQAMLALEKFEGEGIGPVVAKYDTDLLDNEEMNRLLSVLIKHPCREAVQPIAELFDSTGSLGLRSKALTALMVQEWEEVEEKVIEIASDSSLHSTLRRMAIDLMGLKGGALAIKGLDAINKQESLSEELKKAVKLGLRSCGKPDVSTSR